ncbi:basic helix-loop-helix ARNT-like protein 2 isoform X3 [Drosophila montana]|uniref:basic helix-loop-helix ARNT-like protein 2 isoform X3 n=1 Tax=Drosophila montana TaxID=40370 RepID=UPI00313E280D
MENISLQLLGREARNRAEKNRRDKLNGSIQELSTMVPHVAESPRRVDKTAVLRFAAHGLRLKYVFGKTLHQQRPQVTDTLMGMLDSFFLTLTCHGQILLISSSIEQHLGHCQTDLYGQSILQITHPEDHEMLKQQLIPTELENLFDAHAEPTDADGEPRQRSKSEEDYIDRKLRDDRRSFRVRLARAGPRSEPTAYEVVKIDGCFRRSDEAPRGVRSNTFSSSLQLIRRTRGRDDAIPLHTISGNDIVLTACARIIRPPKIVNRLFDANTLEYRTRHLIDGRIIDCDQRIGIVAGYMTDEVRNLNPFTFMHNDDVRWVIVALRQMYDCNSSYGESTYRLFTRNGNIIYLQSKGYLEIDKETNKVHSFVCVNTLLGDEEGRRRVQEMKKKFSVIINTQIPQSTIDVPASEHPAQLEKAVLCLIQNLQSGGSDHDNDRLDADDDDDDNDTDDDIEDGLSSITNFSHASQPHDSQQQHHQHHHRHGHGHHSHHNFLDSTMSQARLGAGNGMGSSKTPPLALVPPETASVKSSISKSVSVVNVTAAKHLRGNLATSAAQSPSSKSTSCSCRGVSDANCDYCQGPLTPETVMGSTSVSLKRSSGAASTQDGQDNVLLAKRLFMPSTAVITHVLGSSLEQMGRTLDQQLSAAVQLREQNSRYEVPHANERIDEILEEHQKQSKLFVDIKSEYEELQNKAANATKTDAESQSSNNSNSGIP